MITDRGRDEVLHDGLVDTLFDASPDAIVVLAPDGHVLLANAAAHELLGNDVVGTVFGIPLGHEGLAEIDLLTPSGPRVAELRVADTTLGGQSVIVATLRDVTERVVARDVLRGFVGTVSHEFRTPIGAIAGFADTLQNSWDELADDRKLRYVGIMERQASRLSRLVDDLLALARLDEGAAEAVPRPTPLQGVFDAVVAVLEMEVTTAGGDLVATVDPDHLETMLVNLLGNAGKYGVAPFELRAQVHGGSVEIRVVDHGPGVPPTFRSRLFERFTRHPATSGNLPGSGLGLPIVRGLVTRNSGHVHFEETPGGGATFVLRLPGA